MNASELRLNTIYKLKFTSTVLSFLTDGQTRVTVVSTDGIIVTGGASLPFSDADYINGSLYSDINIDDHDDNNQIRLSGATYILYYITTLNATECTILAQYSEKCDLKLDTLYKIDFSKCSTDVNFLSNGTTRITIVESDPALPAVSVFSNIRSMEYAVGNNSLYIADSSTAVTLENIKYIVYYITTLNQAELVALAQYSEDYGTGPLSNIIKISQADYTLLYNAYPDSVSGRTYDPKAIYLISSGSAPTKKYRHNITLGVSGTYLQFSFVNSDSTNYATTTNWSRLLAAVSAAGFTSSTYTCPARGLTWVSTAKSSNLIIGIYCGTSGVLSFKSIALSYNSDTTVTFNQYVNATSTGISSISGIYDTVEEL